MRRMGRMGGAHEKELDALGLCPRMNSTGSAEIASRPGRGRVRLRKRTFRQTSRLLVHVVQTGADELLVE